MCKNLVLKIDIQFEDRYSLRCSGAFAEFATAWLLQSLLSRMQDLVDESRLVSYLSLLEE